MNFIKYSRAIAESSTGSLNLKSYAMSLLIIMIMGGVIAGIQLLFMPRDVEPDAKFKVRLSVMYPIIGPAVTTLFWLIQISPALALGLLGAMSFIRVRWQMKRSEDITFVLILIASALACSLQQYIGAFSIIGISAIYGLVRRVFFAKTSPVSNESMSVSFATIQSCGVSDVAEVIRASTGSVALLKSEYAAERSAFLFRTMHVDMLQQDGLMKRLRGLDPSAAIEFRVSEED